MDKACVAQKRSEELDRRAASVGSGGISSDDPDAVAKLRRQFEDLEHRQATYVSTNKMIRKGDREGLAGLGFSETEIAKLFEPDWAGRIGIPDYVMKNNGANIRRLRKRIESLEAKATAPAREPIEGEGYRIVEDLELNRCCVEFDAKPEVQIRRELKLNGFRWSPTRDAWIRQLSNGAWHAAQYATRSLRAFPAGHGAPLPGG
jgi:hypothetical protein